jgi:hypothetical protein
MNLKRRPAKVRTCDKARECLRLTGGKVICPEGDYCALYDELGDGTLECVLYNLANLSKYRRS